MKRVAMVVGCCGLLLSGCLSATVTDARLTALGRTAVPLAGQSLIQQVVDAADCRERIMDSLFYIGAYALYNPFRYNSREDALYGWQQRLARCLRERGYGVVEPPAPPPPRT